MKIQLKLTAFFLMAVYLFLSCNKDKDPTSVTAPPLNPFNQPPIAKAGPDQSFTLLSCNSRTVAVLNGSGSTDTDNNITGYNWNKISGPGGYVLIKLSSGTARVENLLPGEYAFELTVIDAGNLSSRDTMLISVKRPEIKEYDLDITFNGTFIFVDNDKDCYYIPCSYYDFTEAKGAGIFPPLGEFNLYFSEYADTAASAYASTSNIYIDQGNFNTRSLYGTSTVNLKKLYQQGGGSFSGTFKVEGGSAKNCDPNLFTSLPPLTLTGNLDTVAKKATVRIKGKAFF
jgi:hypothetical protein